MRARSLVLSLLVLVFGASMSGQTTPLARAPERPDANVRYLFYLHGRIVEDQGAEAVSPDYGRYEYAAILQQLAARGFIVVSEVRPRDTDPERYASLVIQQIQQLLAGGVSPRNIAVVGASKGAVIAMLVSTRFAGAIRYVLLANCNDFIFKMFPLSLRGDVLSIYEASDSLGQTCEPLFERSPALGEQRELRLETGLRHGFIFRPLEAWVGPAVSWARGEQ
jgi:hypothetical protein